jgi:hypothetical protein
LAWEARYRDEGAFDETATIDNFGGEVCASACVVVLVVQVINRRTFRGYSVFVYRGFRLEQGD